MARITWKSVAEQNLEKTKELQEQKAAEALAKSLPAILTAVRKMIRIDELTPDEIDSMIDLYPVLTPGQKYLKDELVQHDGKLYKLLQPEITYLANWNPAELPALFLPIVPPEIIAPWVQPYGGSGTYKLGARVLFEGKVYENIYTAKEFNVWSPTGYPQGWKLIP